MAKRVMKMRMTRDEFLDEMARRYPEDPDMVRLLAECLEMVGVLGPIKPRYYPRDLAVECPTCQAPPGEECRTRPGKPGTWLPSPHEQRQQKGAAWAGKQAAEGL
jgi:hypothetical protein